MKFNKFVFFIFLFLFLISFVSAAYIQSNVKTSSGITSGSFKKTSFQESPFKNFDNSMCKEGTDFIIQLSPFGCTPSVVRSDLLEEEDAYVFCEIQAMKLNPLIDVTNIDSINFKGDYPSEIRHIGFYPKQSALRKNLEIDENSLFNSIGYIVIQIRQNKNESSLMNCEKGTLGSEVCYLSGNLTATLKYDIENSFGLKNKNFYLPVMGDYEFDKTQGQYDFFEKRGFLRADYVDSEQATIGIYSGVYENRFGRGDSDSVAKKKIFEQTLKKGESSSKIFLPGYECLAGISFKLEDIDFADTTISLSVNSEVTKLKEGESFLDGRCFVVKNSLEKRGLNQKVRISCKEDEENLLKSSFYDLRISPKVKFKIGSKEVEASVGDKLYSEGDKSVYFAYIYSKDETFSSEALEVTLLIKPSIDEKLIEKDVEFMACLKEKETNKLMKFSCGMGETLFKWFVEGESNKDLNFIEHKLIEGQEVSILGFADGENFPLNEETSLNYKNGLESYDKVLQTFAGETYPDSDMKTLGERAAFFKIMLASSLDQKADVKFFCQDFLENFPDSDLDGTGICENSIYQSSDLPNDVDVLINGNYKRIALERISEPNIDDYGIVLNIRKKDGSYVDEIRLGKSYNINLNELTGESSLFVVSNGFRVLKDLYFLYDGTSWVWSSDMINWMPSSVIVVWGGEDDGESPKHESKILIHSLKYKDYEDRYAAHKLFRA